MMSIFDPVDIYCERTAIGLLNEPLNAITNLSFFIATWMLYRLYCGIYGKPDLPKQNFLIIALLLTVASVAYLILPAQGNTITIAAAVICYFYYLYRKTHAPKIEGESYLGAAKRVFTGPKREAEALIVCIALVGLGSLTFHMYANWLSMWFDVFPIVMLVGYYVFVSLKRLAGWSFIKAFLGLVVFLPILVQAENIPPPYNFNGSAAYFPCLAFILLLTWYLRRKGHPSATLLFKASLIFMLSLTFRTMDMAVCETLPLGTHFLWHICNGMVLYLLARAILEQRPVPAN